MLHASTLLLAVWACGIGYFDARYRRIPNVLSLTALAVGVGMLLIQHRSLSGATPPSALMGTGLAALLTLPAYVVRKLGAGDVKYLMAIGILTSLQITLNTFVIAALLGGLMGLLWWRLPALSRALPANRFGPDTALGRWMRLPTRERRMAFGTLLSLGLLCSLWLEVRP